jgi:hypothetical protein
LEKKNVNKINRKFLKWQVFVLVTAAARIFLTSFNSIVDDTVRFTQFKFLRDLQGENFIFGMIIAGNLIDNAVDPKGILLICEAYFSISLIGLGLVYL